MVTGWHYEYLARLEGLEGSKITERRLRRSVKGGGGRLQAMLEGYKLALSIEQDLCSIDSLHNRRL